MNGSPNLHNYIIDNYIPKQYFDSTVITKGTSPSINPSFTPLGTTVEHDEVVKYFESAKARLKKAQEELQQKQEKALLDPFFVINNTVSQISRCIPLAHDPKLKEAIEQLQEAYEEFETAKDQLLEPDQPGTVYGNLTESKEKSYFFDDEKLVSETTPSWSSFTFGAILLSQLTQNQQKTIVEKLSKTTTDSSFDPFSGMMRDLDRASFSLTDENGKDITLDRKDRTSSFEKWQKFIGQNRYLQIAIASLMYQEANFDLEAITSPEPIARDNNEPTSLPYYTLTENGKLYTPTPEGPIFRFLSMGEGKIEHPSYNLEKKITDSGALIFRLTAMDYKGKNNYECFYDSIRHVSYEFEENQAFDAKKEISLENSPVTVRCSSGAISQAFSTRETPEQYQYHIAQQRLVASQEKLAALGNSEHIKNERNKKMNFLAARAAFLPNTIITEGIDKANKGPKSLQKAEQNVIAAQRDVIAAQQNLQLYSPTENEGK